MCAKVVLLWLWAGWGGVVVVVVGLFDILFAFVCTQRMVSWTEVVGCWGQGEYLVVEWVVGKGGGGGGGASGGL